MKDVYRGRARSTARVARQAMLAAAITFSIPSPLFSSSASAEVHDPLRGYALDGTPVAGGPPPPRAHDAPATDGADPAVRGPVYVSSGRIRKIAARQGLRLVSLHRRGRSYSATALNVAGRTIDVTFNALNGAIIDQRDVSPAVAAVPSGPAAVQPANAAGAVAPADDSLAAVRAAAAKAAAAEAEARQLAATRATEARLAQSRLAEAEAAALKAAQAKAVEERRARRNDAKAAEARRRILADAESRLAQAKAAQARIEADVKQAEAKAAQARAAMAPPAMAPAEMTKTSETPAAMKPVATPAPVVAVKSPEAPAAAVPPPGSTPPSGTANDDDKKSDDKKSETIAPPDAVPGEAASAESKDAATPSGDATTSEATTSEPTESEAGKADAAAAGKPKIDTGGADKVSEKKSDTSESTGPVTDMAPTGSTILSPPEPYHAPTPDEAAAAVEKH